MKMTDGNPTGEHGKLLVEKANLEGRIKGPKFLAGCGVLALTAVLGSALLYYSSDMVRSVKHAYSSRVEVAQQIDQPTPILPEPSISDEGKEILNSLPVIGKTNHNPAEAQPSPTMLPVPQTPTPSPTPGLAEYATATPVLQSSPSGPSTPISSLTGLLEVIRADFKAAIDNAQNSKATSPGTYLSTTLGEKVNLAEAILFPTAIYQGEKDPRYTLHPYFKVRTASDGRKYDDGRVAYEEREGKLFLKLNFKNLNKAEIDGEQGVYRVIAVENRDKKGRKLDPKTYKLKAGQDVEIEITSPYDIARLKGGKLILIDHAVVKNINGVPTKMQSVEDLTYVGLEGFKKPTLTKAELDSAADRLASAGEQQRPIDLNDSIDSFLSYERLPVSVKAVTSLEDYRASALTGNSYGNERSSFGGTQANYNIFNLFQIIEGQKGRVNGLKSWEYGDRVKSFEIVYRNQYENATKENRAILEKVRNGFFDRMDKNIARRDWLNLRRVGDELALSMSFKDYYQSKVDDRKILGIGIGKEFSFDGKTYVTVPDLIRAA